MELIELKTNMRTGKGKGLAHRLRRDGQVPAVLYGPGTDPVPLTLVTSELEQVLKKGPKSQLILNLVINGGERSPRTTMIKELQVNPVTRDILHADFYEVAMDRKIKVKIPVHVTGKCLGIEAGGILQIVHRELEVMCLPTEIPKEISLDVTNLNVGNSIHVKEIQMAGNTEIVADTNFTVVTVVMPKREAVVTAAEGEGAEEAAAEEAPAAEKS